LNSLNAVRDGNSKEERHTPEKSPAAYTRTKEMTKDDIYIDNMERENTI